jgi:ubiquinone/menaquinone biosynthesis C-methylase UbiE
MYFLEVTGMISAWMDTLNAQLYEEYAQRFPMYRKLGKKLIELAAVQPGQTVVDLACGTGIVTAQLQEQLQDRSKIIGVDMSPAMLAIARKKLPTVEFIEARAEQLHEVIPGSSVDAVICNSAFWQMDTEKTLIAIKQVLKPGGRFIFNLSESDRIPPSESSAPSLHRIMWRIATEEYNYVRPQPSPTRPKPRLTVGTPFKEVYALLQTAPLTLQSYEEAIEIEHTAESTYAFNKMPVMTWWLSGLDYTIRREILEKAYQRLDKSYRTALLWRFYGLEKID